jgi:hypothetical protein
VRLALRARAQVYLFGVVCLVGATYAHAAIEKMRLGEHLWSWMLDDHLANIFVSGHKHGGWLRGVSDAKIISIARVLDWFRLPMAIGTIVVELGMAFLLVRPRLTRWLPAAAIGLHLAIYLTSGIFFWKWMLVHLAFMWWVRKLMADDSAGSEPVPASAPLAIYRRPTVVLSLIVILGSRFLWPNVAFAWADTRLTNFFVIRGVGQSGKSYRIDARFFAPYDLTVQQCRFYYTMHEPVLVGTYGSSNSLALAETLETTTPETLPALVAERGVVRYNPRAIDALGVFLQHSLEVAMRRGHRGYWLHTVSAPYHFQTTVGEVYAFQEPLVAFNVTFEEWLYHDDQLTRTREIMVMRAPLH